LNQSETGEIEPEFRPIQLIFKDKRFTQDNYSELIVENDIFAIFYQHTTGIQGVDEGQSNFYSGRLKESPFQIISYFRQDTTGSQYIVISIFELDDEIDIFEDLIRTMAVRLDYIFETLEKARKTQQISLISKITTRLGDELKFTLFQVERLSNLDKLQKAALIFNSNERLAILDTLRENPISKREMKNILEKLKANPNVDILVEPFLELNLIRRDWVKGIRNKETGIYTNQGEYLFLTKDIALVRVPNLGLLTYLKDSKNELYPKYQQRVTEFFANYDPLKQTVEETKKLASLLLNPDIYDNLVLMKSKFYPIDKIPKIFSDFADIEMMLEDLKNLNIVTEIKDKKDRSWILLLCEIKPLIFFPEYILPKIRKAYKSFDKEQKITREIAKRALSLLELTFPEKVEF
ncbi:MAG: hypothetical protein ACTSUT_21205, partial [Promethearchaeota archaeon]